MKKIVSVILFASLFACSDSDASKSASKSTAKSENTLNNNTQGTEVVSRNTGPFVIDTAVSTLRWLGWEGPKSNNHTHYGTMKFLDGKIKLSPLKEKTIESGDFTLSLSSIFVEDLKNVKRKKHLKKTSFGK